MSLLEILPKEILLTIVDIFKVSDILQLCLVSKGYSNLCNELKEYIIYKHIGNFPFLLNLSNDQFMSLFSMLYPDIEIICEIAKLGDNIFGMKKEYILLKSLINRYIKLNVVNNNLNECLGELDFLYTNEINKYIPYFNEYLDSYGSNYLLWDKYNDQELIKLIKEDKNILYIMLSTAEYPREFFTKYKSYFLLDSENPFYIGYYGNEEETISYAKLLFENIVIPKYEYNEETEELLEINQGNEGSYLNKIQSYHNLLMGYILSNNSKDHVTLKLLDMMPVDAYKISMEWDYLLFPIPINFLYNISNPNIFKFIYDNNYMNIKNYAGEGYSNITHISEQSLYLLTPFFPKYFANEFINFDMTNLTNIDIFKSIVVALSLQDINLLKNILNKFNLNIKDII